LAYGQRIIAIKKTRSFFKTLWEAVTGKEHEYTSGSIDRAIVLLAVPMILEMVMEALFALVDIFFVSKIDTLAASTVGLTEVVLMLIESVAFGIAMAATGMIARRIGEKDIDGIWVGLGIAIPLGLFGWFFAKEVLALMGGSPELIAYGYEYTQIVLGLNVILFFLILFNSFFRGAGDAAIAMRTLILANGLNIVLDPALIFGLGPFPEMGLKGAAIATCIGRGVGLLYQLYYLCIHPQGVLKIKRKHFSILVDIIKKILNLSFGGVSQFMVNTISWLFLVRIIAQHGDIAVAGYAIAIRIIIFTILPAWGLSMAAATLVGQNLGAEKPHRAEQSVWRAAQLNMFFLLFISILFFFAAPYILPLFDPNPAVIKEGIAGLQIILLGYIFYAYGMVIGQAFNGAGDTYTPLFMNIVAFWVIQTPLAYFLSNYVGLGSHGCYWAITIANSILAGISIFYFRKGKWKEKSV